MLVVPETAVINFCHVQTLLASKAARVVLAAGQAITNKNFGSEAVGVDLSLEGDRWKARDAISAVLQPWFRERTFDEIGAAFAGSGVCWGPYQTFRQMVAEDPRCSERNPMFSMQEQPGIGRYLVPGSPIHFAAVEREAPVRAPLLGEHTDAVLAEVLGLSAAAIGKLRDEHIVGGPIEL